MGYSVAIRQSGAYPALRNDGRSIYVSGALNTDGAGYIYITELSAPMTVTFPKAQNLVIAGAKTNKISGTAGGMTTAVFQFFDVPSLRLPLARSLTTFA